MATLWRKIRTPQKTRTLPEIYPKHLLGGAQYGIHTYAVREAIYHALAVNVVDPFSPVVAALDVFAAVRKLTYLWFGNRRGVVVIFKNTR